MQPLRNAGPHYCRAGQGTRGHEHVSQRSPPGAQPQRSGKRTRDTRAPEELVKGTKAVLCCSLQIAKVVYETIPHMHTMGKDTARCRGR